MATLALGVAGSVVGGSIVGSAGLTGWVASATLATASIIGTGLGGFADAAFLLPSIMPGAPDQEGPRIKSIDVPEVSEGGIIPRCYGGSVRIPGTIIWMSNLNEYKIVDPINASKFGPDSNLITYKYTVDVAVALNEGQIERVKAIWANGRKIYDNFSLFLDAKVVESDKIAVANNGSFPQIFPGLTVYFTTADGPDLRIFEKESTVTITGFTNVGNNVVNALVIGTGQWIDSGVPVGTFVAVVNATSVTEAAGDDITILQTDRPIKSPAHIWAVNVYDGTQTDSGPDSLWLKVVKEFFSALSGISVGPSYHGVAYVLLQGLRLEDFGNRLPNLSFEVVEDSDRTVAETIADILDRAGVTNYDVSAVPSRTLRGYAIQTAMSAAQALRPILRAYNLIVRESQGTLEFLERGSEDVLVIAAEDLAAHEFGQEVPRKLTIVDISDRVLPGEVDVQYIDGSADYQLQRASQRQRLIQHPLPTTLSIDIPLTLTSVEARNIAIRELYEAHTNRRTVRLVLPPKYIELEEQDVITIDVDGEIYSVLVTKINRGANFLMEVEGLVESASLYEFDPPADEGAIDPPFTKIYAPPDLGLVVLDIPPMTPTDAGMNGFYVGVIEPFPEDVWRGAIIQVSEAGDVDEEYRSVGFAEQQCAMGKTLTDLPDRPVGVWFDDDTVDVFLLRDDVELESYSKQEALRGLGWCMIGDEKIAYQTAEKLDTYTWRLTGLIRGLKGTGWAIPDNNDNPRRFVRLWRGQLTPVELDRSLVGKQLYVRAIAFGDDGDRSYPQPLTFTNSMGRPRAPINLRYYRHKGNYNVYVWWDRASTWNFSLFSAYTDHLYGDRGHWLLRVTDTGRVTDYYSIKMASGFWGTSWLEQQSWGFVGAATMVVQVYEVTPNGTASLAAEIEIPGPTA